MNINCKCGGKFYRSELLSFHDQKLKRTIYEDLDPFMAHWKCDKCGETRTQRKRVGVRRAMECTTA